MYSPWLCYLPWTLHKGLTPANLFQASVKAMLKIPHRGLWTAPLRESMYTRMRAHTRMSTHRYMNTTTVDLKGWLCYFLQVIGPGPVYKLKRRPLVNLNIHTKYNSLGDIWNLSDVCTAPLCFNFSFFVINFWLEVSLGCCGSPKGKATAWKT